MNLDNFKYISLFDSDDNERKIDIYKLHNCYVTGHNCHYPNAMLRCNGNVYNPIDEIIMSLKDVKQKEISFNIKSSNNIIDTPVFYFIYNVENYYHFIYDTLPYLISYIHIRKSIPNLKLLTNYSVGQTKLYKFVSEFLDLLNIKESNILIADDITMYTTVYVSSSYTHGNDPNKPPRKEIYDFYQYIVSLVPKILNTPKKIYISRRTWVHNDLTNIGTNYTTRRKLINEDGLVERLSLLGYTEIFTESLSTLEKIQLFSNADEVIGSIGGGLVNVLFSKPNCKLFALISPTFLDINQRFRYSFSNVITTYYTDCTHTSIEDYKLYMRVQVGDIVGEISDINGNDITIEYVDYPVAGWNSTSVYKTITVDKSKCIKLDNGLNSPWIINLKGLLNLL
jgi:hypothetical protein